MTSFHKKREITFTFERVLHMEKTKKVFNIPVTWQVYGVMKVEAESFEEAKKLVYGNAPLPNESTYVDDSIQIDEDVLLDYITPTKVQIDFVTYHDCWYLNRIGHEFDVVRITEDKDHYIVNDNGVEREVLVQDCKILDIA